MKKQLLALVATIVSFMSFSAWSQDAVKFTVSGGGGAKNGSVYSSMVGTMAEVCSTDTFTITEVTSSGGPDNLDRMLSNKVRAAILPSDLLLATEFENAASVAQIKTLVSLHYEAAHLIVRGDVKKEGGISLGSFKNIGGTEVVFDTPESLKGRPVGVVGGSKVTAGIINDMSKFGWMQQQFESTSKMLEALTAKQIDAVLISAGMQSDAVKAIKGNFKLLPLRANGDLLKVYKPVKVQYQNLNGGRAVDTLGARAVLAVRVSRDPDMVKNLAALRQCLVSKIAKISETDGAHAAWGDVDPDDRSTWKWYDLPTQQVAATPKKK